VSGYPTVAFVNSEGELIGINPGFSPPEEFFGVMESTFKEEEVFKELKVAVQKNPNDSKANARLALIYIKRGKFEQGKPLFDKVVKQDPSNGTGLLPELYVNLALYYGQNAIGDKEKEYYQKAEEYLRAVVENYSDSELYEDAQHYLGITYALQEKVELAIATFEKLSDAKDEEIRQQAAMLLKRLKGSVE
jgi:tetratricopeptide (TPR) repeat protein